MEKANVTAIHKKGEKDMSCNYMPVSLASQVCKILETIIRDSMVDYLNKY